MQVLQKEINQSPQPAVIDKRLLRAYQNINKSFMELGNRMGLSNDDPIYDRVYEEILPIFSHVDRFDSFWRGVTGGDMPDPNSLLNRPVSIDGFTVTYADGTRKTIEYNEASILLFNAVFNSYLASEDPRMHLKERQMIYRGGYQIRKESYFVFGSFVLDEEGKIAKDEGERPMEGMVVYRKTQNNEYELIDDTKVKGLEIKGMFYQLLENYLRTGESDSLTGIANIPSTFRLHAMDLMSVKVVKEIFPQIKKEYFARLKRKKDDDEKRRAGLEAVLKEAPLSVKTLSPVNPDVKKASKERAVNLAALGKPHGFVYIHSESLGFNLADKYGNLPTKIYIFTRGKNADECEFVFSYPFVWEGHVIEGLPEQVVVVKDNGLRSKLVSLVKKDFNGWGSVIENEELKGLAEVESQTGIRKNENPKEISGTLNVLDLVSEAGMRSLSTFVANTELGHYRRKSKAIGQNWINTDPNMREVDIFKKPPLKKAS